MGLLARREDKLKALCGRINSAVDERRAEYLVHDVTEYEPIPLLYERALKILGEVDLVIYNSGILLPIGSAEYFQKRGAGQIVGISSVGGEHGRTGAPAYNRFKAAINIYLEALRNRLLRFGIHVLTVKPGFISTAMIQNARESFWVAPVELAVSDTLRGIHKRKQEAYTPGRWRVAGWLLRNVHHL